VDHLSDKDILLRYFDGLFWISGPEGQIKDIKTAVWLSLHMGPITSFLSVDMNLCMLTITRSRTPYRPDT
jgi:hypothetical protein